MKNDIAKILLLIFILIGCRSWGGKPEDKKPDPRDTVQKPLPDSILVKDSSIKAGLYFRMDGRTYILDSVSFEDCDIQLGPSNQTPTVALDIPSMPEDSVVFIDLQKMYGKPIYIPHRDSGYVFPQWIPKENEIYEIRKRKTGEQ